MQGKDSGVDLPELWRLWVANVQTDKIADRFNVSTTCIYNLARKHKLPRRSRVCKDTNDPTPGEIAERAAYCRMMRERGTPVGG
jgi:hypothetical protein